MKYDLSRILFCRQWAAFGALRLFGAEFFGGEFLGGGEGVGGGNLYVGLDAGSFPVGLRDGVDGPGEGHANHEMGVNAVTGNGMGAASGGFADEGGAFQILVVVAELLGARESSLRRERICRLAVQAVPGHVRPRPILVALIPLSLPGIVQAGGL